MSQRFCILNTEIKSLKNRSFHGALWTSLDLCSTVSEADWVGNLLVFQMEKVMVPKLSQARNMHPEQRGFAYLSPWEVHWRSRGLGLLLMKACFYFFDGHLPISGWKKYEESKTFRANIKKEGLNRIEFRKSHLLKFFFQI